MDKAINTNAPVQPIQKKHMKSFWPLAIIFVLAAIVAGLVLWFTFNNTLDDQINSLVPRVHIRQSKHATSTPSATSGSLQKKNIK